MGLLGTAILALVPLGLGPVECSLVQIAPSAFPQGYYERAPGQERAVVLLHGLGVHPFSKAKVETAELRSWQQPGSLLVRHLAPHADVYAFAYAQNAPVEQIAERCALADAVAILRRMGYREVVLVGHSAGGLIARQLVEDRPDAGVTKVIQVCAPNAGSSWATLEAVRANQVAFLASLSCSGRRCLLDQRAAVRVPLGIEFACIVGTAGPALRQSDVVVPCRSQWSDELQDQGIPAFPVRIAHWDAMKNARSVELITRLVCEPVPRWSAAEVASARKKVLGQ